jgi:hypothetical protein
MKHTFNKQTLLLIHSPLSSGILLMIFLIVREMIGRDDESAIVLPVECVTSGAKLTKVQQIICTHESAEEFCRSHTIACKMVHGS